MRDVSLFCAEIRGQYSGLEDVAEGRSLDFEKTPAQFHRTAHFLHFRHGRVHKSIAQGHQFVVEQLDSPHLIFATNLD